MSIYVVAALCVVLIAMLFGFAYLMDRWHGCALMVIMFAWVLTMQPARADDMELQAPDITAPMVWVAKGYNAFGDRILLAANFCGGNADNSRRDHMHVYAIYNSHGSFLGGGCWKYDPEGTRRTHQIHYFDMSGIGWDVWPSSGFKAVH